MSAIADANAYPPDIVALRDGLDGFLKQEVIARHERHAALLDDERRLFTDDGRYHPDALALIREVRMAASRAGYYGMCVPTSLGGAAWVRWRGSAAGSGSFIAAPTTTGWATMRSATGPSAPRQCWSGSRRGPATRCSPA